MSNQKRECMNLNVCGILAYLKALRISKEKIFKNHLFCASLVVIDFYLLSFYSFKRSINLKNRA